MPELNRKSIVVAQAEHAGGETTAGEAHGAEGAGGHGADTHASAGHGEHHSTSPLAHHSPFENSLSGGVVAVLLVVFAVLATRNLKKIPTSKLQALAEIIVEGFRSFARTSIGPGGEKFAPLIGSLFLFIFCSNLVGALPLMWNGEKGAQEMGPAILISPMANISMTLALATVVFLVVQYTAIKEQTLAGRLKHLAGPVWWLSWLIFPLELFGELVRPLSLSLRLFGNIFGEEMIIGVLIGLLALLPVPLPLHLPIVMFGLLTALVQAGVFTLLTCVYLQLAMDHGHDDHGHEHAAEGHGDHTDAHRAADEVRENLPAAPAAAH